MIQERSDLSKIHSESKALILYSRQFYVVELIILLEKIHQRFTYILLTAQSFDGHMNIRQFFRSHFRLKPCYADLYRAMRGIE